MIKPKVYHATLTANTAYTFSFDDRCSTFIVKNLGTENLKLSYGDSIDDDSYILVLPKTAETISSSFISTPETETDKVTVVSTAAGDVEIRLLEF